MATKPVWRLGSDEAWRYIEFWTEGSMTRLAVLRCEYAEIERDGEAAVRRLFPWRYR